MRGNSSWSKSVFEPRRVFLLAAADALDPMSALGRTLLSYCAGNAIMISEKVIPRIHACSVTDFRVSAKGDSRVTFS